MFFSTSGLKNKVISTFNFVILNHVGIKQKNLSCFIKFTRTIYLEPIFLFLKTLGQDVKTFFQSVFFLHFL